MRTRRPCSPASPLLLLRASQKPYSTASVSPEPAKEAPLALPPGEATPGDCRRRDAQGEEDFEEEAVSPGGKGSHRPAGIPPEGLWGLIVSCVLGARFVTIVGLVGAYILVGFAVGAFVVGALLFNLGYLAPAAPASRAPPGADSPGEANLPHRGPPLPSPRGPGKEKAAPILAEPRAASKAGRTSQACGGEPLAKTPGERPEEKTAPVPAEPWAASQAGRTSQACGGEPLKESPGEGRPRGRHRTMQAQLQPWGTRPGVDCGSAMNP